MAAKRRLLSLVMVIVLTLSLCSMAISAPEGKSGDIIILTTNDVHNRIEEHIGYAGLAAYKAKMEAIAGASKVTLIDAGDAIQGAPIGVISKGEYLIDIMDYVGYDLAIPGNHEFDYGMERFLELAGKASFPYIACNFIDLVDNKPVFDAYKIIDYGTAKVGYVGISTPESFTKSTPKYFQNENGEYVYSFCEDISGEKLYAQVQKTIDEVKAKGVDYIIAVAHLGVDKVSRPWTSVDVVENTSGLDAIIDGHSHTEIDGKIDGELIKDKSGKEVPCVQAGQWLQNIGKIVITPGKGLVAGLVSAEDFEEKDEKTQALIDDIKAEYEDEILQVVAKTDIALTTTYPGTSLRAVRSDETNLGDLCADAYRNIMEADVAIVNGGGVRADIATGDITLKDILTVHPFGNLACLIEAKGQNILDALEHGSRALPGELGGFLQVSGMSYSVDATIPSSVVVDDKGTFVSVSGERRVKDVLVDGVPIDPQKTYKLASIGYMLKDMGDGYSMFSNCNILKDDVMVDSQILIDYIVEVLGGVVGQEYANPRGQGRISITSLFKDIKTSAWYYTSIKDAKDKGLVNGVSETRFAPDEMFTRAMLVTILYRASGDKAEPGDAFSDVPSSAWYADAVAWALENGIIAGDGDGMFRPNEAISRQEMAVLIYNYYAYLGEETEIAELTYDDSDAIADWAAMAVGFCLKSGIMIGVEDNMFQPAQSSSRAQGAAVLSRIKLPTPDEEAA